MKTGIIIQARMGSTRLPGKVMMDLGGKPVLSRVIERCQRIESIDNICLATTVKEEDTQLCDLAWEHGLDIYAGSEHDVLDRYYQAAVAGSLDVIVRITADCPLLDPEVSSRVVSFFHRNRYDYVSNVHPPSYPDGLDTEVFTMDSLCKAWTHGKGSEREHVTPYIWKRPWKFNLGNLMYSKDLANHRWTLDTEDDYKFLKAVYGYSSDLTMEQVLALPISHTLPRTIRL